MTGCVEVVITAASADRPARDVLALPIQAGDPAYLDRIRAETREP